MPSPRAHTFTRLMVRLQALLDALRDGPLHLPDLVARLGAAYPQGDSARRMIDRDRARLAALGIVVERTSRPLTYRLRGGTPSYTPEELRTLALYQIQLTAPHGGQAHLHSSTALPRAVGRCGAVELTRRMRGCQCQLVSFATPSTHGTPRPRRWRPCSPA